MAIVSVELLKQTPLTVSSKPIEILGLGLSTLGNTSIELSDQRRASPALISVRELMEIEFKDGAYRPDDSPINAFDRTESGTFVIDDSTVRQFKVNYLFKSKVDGFSMVMHGLWKDDSTGVGRVYKVTNNILSSATENSADYSFRYIFDGNTNATFPTLGLALTIGGYNSGLNDGSY